jgi:hypothetical protein
VKIFTVINPIAGELLSSIAHFLFGFTLAKIKKVPENLVYNIEGLPVKQVRL